MESRNRGLEDCNIGKFEFGGFGILGIGGLKDCTIAGFGIFGNEGMVEWGRIGYCRIEGLGIEELGDRGIKGLGLRLEE